MVASNVTSYCYIVITNDNINDPVLFILFHTLYGYYAVIMKVVLVILQLYGLALLVFPQAMNYIVVSLLCDQFDKLNKEFNKCVGDRGEFHGNFEQFRRRHQTISRSVKEADQFLMISNVAGFFCNMFGTIVVVFCLTFYRMFTVEEISTYIYWLVVNIFGLSLAAGLAIIVNNMVHFLLLRNTVVVVIVVVAKKRTQNVLKTTLTASVIDPTHPWYRISEWANRCLNGNQAVRHRRLW